MRPRSMRPGSVRPGRPAFTLVEVTVAGAIVAVVLGVVLLLSRQFLYNMLWSGETFAGIHEAAVLEGTLRRDLARAGVAGRGLAVETDTGVLKITFPAGSTPAVVTYTIDAAASSLVRAADAGPKQPLAVGMVRAFAVTPRFVVARAGAHVIVPAVLEGDRVERAGLLLELTIKGQQVAGNAQAAQGLVLATHVFPHFANLALASIWRPVGGKK